MRIHIVKLPKFFCSAAFLLLLLLHSSRCFAEDEPYPPEFYEPDKQTERPPMPFFGAGLTTTNAEAMRRNHTHANEGVLVIKVYPNSTASEMGIKVGDLLVRVNDANVTGARTASRALGGVRPGQSMAVNIIRDGEKHQLKGTMKTARNSFIAGMTEEQRMAYYLEKREEHFIKRMLMHEQNQINYRKKNTKSDQNAGSAASQGGESDSGSSLQFTLKYSISYNSEEL